MTQHPKKHTDTPAQAKPSSGASRMSESVIKLVDPARKLQEKTLEIGRKNVEQLRGAADGMGRVAAEYRDVCSGNVDALVEAGSITTHNLQTMSNDVKETGNRALQDVAVLLKEVVACKSIHDVLELQNKALKQATDSYFELTKKLCDAFFDSCSEAITPLNERSEVAAKQIHKAMSA